MFQDFLSKKAVFLLAFFAIGLLGNSHSGVVDRYASGLDLSPIGGAAFLEQAADPAGSLLETGRGTG